MFYDSILTRIENVTYILLSLYLNKWENRHSQTPLKVRKHFILERFAEAKGLVLLWAASCLGSKNLERKRVIG